MGGRVTKQKECSSPVLIKRPFRDLGAPVLPPGRTAHLPWRHCTRSQPFHLVAALSRKSRPPHHCATERSYSSFQKVLGVNLTKIFSCSVALASNRLSCFPPSIRTPNSLPGIENNLNKPVHPELGAGRLTLPLLLCPCQDKGLVTDSRRAGIPKNPRGPVVPSGSRSKESWGL